MPQPVFIIAADGTRLPPTFNQGKAKELLKRKKATVYSYRPFFAIQLGYTPENIVIPEIEACFDTGEQHIGLSVKSEKHEFVSRQCDNLTNEKERHDGQRKTRRSQRNQKRYREPRFDNRAKKPVEGLGKWFAPSLRHELNNHLYLLKELLKVCPVSTVWTEMGSFDIQALMAIEKGEPLPQGTDYQYGPKYKHDTLREAVFFRDGHKCLVCGKGIGDGAILRMHHLGFKEGDRSDRMANLATVCTKCHTPANHQPSGVLWDFEPELATFSGAAFMNTTRWEMYNHMKDIAGEHGAEVHMTYGSVTKRERLNRHIRKSHANDAYCIGNFHPKHRTRTEFYEKLRRNNRRIQMFYDAKYYDIRDGSEKAGKEIGCNRQNRKQPRNWEKNERIYRGHKTQKGYVKHRVDRYGIRLGDPLLYNGKKVISAGMHCKGREVTYKGIKYVQTAEISPAVTKRGDPIPVEPGNMCMYTTIQKKGRRVRLLSMDTESGIVGIRWTFSVPVGKVKRVSFAGGWKRYVPDSLYVYSRTPSYPHKARLEEGDCG